MDVSRKGVISATLALSIGPVPETLRIFEEHRGLLKNRGQKQNKKAKVLWGSTLPTSKYLGRWNLRNSAFSCDCRWPRRRRSHPNSCAGGGTFLGDARRIREGQVSAVTDLLGASNAAEVPCGYSSASLLRRFLVWLAKAVHVK